MPLDITVLTGKDLADKKEVVMVTRLCTTFTVQKLDTHYFKAFNRVEFAPVGYKVYTSLRAMCEDLQHR